MKIALCIEYDGQQHYYKTEFGSKVKAEEKLKLTKLRDSIKTEYCKNNNIKIIIFIEMSVKNM